MSEVIKQHIQEGDQGTLTLTVTYSNKGYMVSIESQDMTPDAWLFSLVDASRRLALILGVDLENVIGHYLECCAPFMARWKALTAEDKEIITSILTGNTGRTLQ